jgi:integrase/recombinase XerC
MLAKLGERVGVVVRPHGLRHASVTDALDCTNGNIRVVQRFSRHRNPRPIRDLAGRLLLKEDEPCR